MSRIFLLVTLAHVYVGLRLMPDLPLHAAGLTLGVLALATSALLLPLAMLSRRMSQPGADRLAWVGFVVMGLFSFVFALTVLRDLALLAISAAGAFTPLRLDAWLPAFREQSSVAVPVLALVLGAWAMVNARRRPAVKRVDILITGLPAALSGFIIAQISDLHVGPTIKRGYVSAIVEAVNALGADLVAITGDLVDGSVAHLAPHAEPLAQLSARHGTFFVTGNHEYYSGAQAWIDQLRRLGLKVLMNEHVVLDHGAAQLVVAGVTDVSAHHYDATQKSDPSAALAGAPGNGALKLLLAHQPRSAYAAHKAGFDLQLSGHTHGGQFLPWSLLIRWLQPFAVGLSRLGSLWIYTSRGTGYWGPPMRLGAPSEITRIRLITA